MRKERKKKKKETKSVGAALWTLQARPKARPKPPLHAHAPSQLPSYRLKYGPLPAALVIRDVGLRWWLCGRECRSAAEAFRCRAALLWVPYGPSALMVPRAGCDTGRRSRCSLSTAPSMLAVVMEGLDAAGGATSSGTGLATLCALTCGSPESGRLASFDRLWLAEEGGGGGEREREKREKERERRKERERVLSRG